MNKPAIYLLGGGGHGRVVAEALRGAGMSVTGILDPALATGSIVDGAKVLGGDDVLTMLDPATAMLALGVGANPSTQHRTILFRDAKARGWEFATVKHKSAILSETCTMQEGCQVMAGAVLQSGVRLGANTVVNTGASLDHDCTVGAHVFVSPGVTVCGAVTIGDGAFIGAGVVIGPGIVIGARAVIGAGAVVLRNVATAEFAAGNPATAKERTNRV